MIHQLCLENQSLIERRSRFLGYQLPRGWWPQPLEHAREIASGGVEVSLPRIPSEQPEDYAQRFRQYKSDFPTLRVIPFDESFYFEGVRLLNQHERKSIDRIYRGMKADGVVEPVTSVPSRIIDGTLHLALDAYIRTGSGRTNSGRRGVGRRRQQSARLPRSTGCRNAIAQRDRTRPVAPWAVDAATLCAGPRLARRPPFRDPR